MVIHFKVHHGDSRLDMNTPTSRNTPPVIIIGMHRSGTSMLARTLRELGVYMGRRRTRNEECLWTNSINYWLFAQSSATWERPTGFDTLLNHPDLCRTLADYMEGIANGPASARYMGLGRWMRYRGMPRIDEPWGWKDPRNTFTLPLWLRVFPRARVIHILRHGVDVAQSLRTRRKRAAEAAARRYRSRRGFYVNAPWAPKRRGFAHAPRVADLEGGFSLWEEYTSKGCGLVQEMGSQALELRYEDLLRDPVPFLDRICEFIGLKPSRDKLRRVSESFEPSKPFSYTHSAELSEFASSFALQLKKFGYGP